MWPFGVAQGRLVGTRIAVHYFGQMIIGYEESSWFYFDVGA